MCAGALWIALGPPGVVMGSHTLKVYHCTRTHSPVAVSVTDYLSLYSVTSRRVTVNYVLEHS